MSDTVRRARSRAVRVERQVWQWEGVKLPCPVQLTRFVWDGRRGVVTAGGAVKV